MAGSEFAKRQLKKHGWTEGSGLGKQEDGRCDPIKVSLKMDKAGVGHDPGKEFTDHWWLRVFNEAAQKIGVKKDASSPNDEKKAREKKMAEDKKNFYKGFVKSSTLTNGVETKDKGSDLSSGEDSDEDANASSSLPTLDDIHKFCGGATGHRAARFGIKMKGKLARVAEHDKLFEEKLKKVKTVPESSDMVRTDENIQQIQPVNNSGTVLDTDLSQGDSSDKKSKKKKKKRKRDELPSEDVDIVNGSVQERHAQNETEDTSAQCVGKKSKKKKRRQEDSTVIDDKERNHLAGSILADVKDGEITQNSHSEEKTGTKTKKRKKGKVDAVDESENVDSDHVKSEKKKKRKKDVCQDELSVSHEESNVVKKKKKRKKEGLS